MAAGETSCSAAVDNGSQGHVWRRIFVPDAPPRTRPAELRLALRKRLHGLDYRAGGQFMVPRSRGPVHYRALDDAEVFCSRHTVRARGYSGVKGGLMN